jgi:hypothetical protein
MASGCYVSIYYHYPCGQWLLCLFIYYHYLDGQWLLCLFIYYHYPGGQWCCYFATTDLLFLHNLLEINTSRVSISHSLLKQHICYGIHGDTVHSC